MAGHAPTVGRDLRIDFFRGMSLFFIFIDHIPDNLLSYVTLRSFAFCDAAEVFIFISGFAAALVYGNSLRRTGALFATAQIWRRVWQLYVAHIFLFMIFTAEVSYALLVAQNPMYTEEMGVGDFLQTPHLAVIRAMLLVFQPTFLDILPLYIVLLAGFPLVLLALEWRPVVPLLASAALYGLTQRFGWAPSNYPSDQPWFFNPLAWQFLFIIGAVAGHSHATGRQVFPSGRWFSRASVAFAGAATLISLSWVLHWVYDPFPALFIKGLWKYTIDKSDLAPLRLVDFLALAVSTVYFIRPDSAFLGWRAARPAILCGQHSLYVFCIGILLSVLGHFVLAEFYDGVAMQLAVNGAGIAVMIGTASLLEWYKKASRPPPQSMAVLPSEAME